MFIGVFAVFFLTGSPKRVLNNSSLSVEKVDVEKSELPAEPSAPSIPPIVPTELSTNTAPIKIEPKQPSLPNKNPVIESQPSNPYAVLMNRGNQNQGNDNPSIQNSLNNLKGQAPSTEALIERNSYFKKLSEQLKDLQGNVNTDEEKPKDTNKNTGPGGNLEEPSDQSVQINDYDEFTEPELGEDLGLAGPE